MCPACVKTVIVSLIPYFIIMLIGNHVYTTYAIFPYAPPPTPSPPPPPPPLTPLPPFHPITATLSCFSYVVSKVITKIACRYRLLMVYYYFYSI